jgi:hypothetical protein
MVRPEGLTNHHGGYRDAGLDAMFAAVPCETGVSAM